jgi:hypothetical protein
MSRLGSELVDGRGTSRVLIFAAMSEMMGVAGIPSVAESNNHAFGKVPFKPRATDRLIGVPRNPPGDFGFLKRQFLMGMEAKLPHNL